MPEIKFPVAGGRNIFFPKEGTCPSCNNAKVHEPHSRRQWGLRLHFSQNEFYRRDPFVVHEGWIAPCLRIPLWNRYFPVATGSASSLKSAAIFPTSTARVSPFRSPSMDSQMLLAIMILWVLFSRWWKFASCVVVLP